MMIVPSDEEYKKAKLVKQGKQKMNPDFIGLAGWINSTFDVSVLNIFYDLNANAYRPSLSIVFEYHSDELKFSDGFLGDYDSEKQKIIADKFAELVSGQIRKPSFFETPNSTSDFKYNTENLFVIFTSFEPVARDEANSLISESEVIELQRNLKLNDLWKIYRQFAGTTFFFYTDKQIDKYSKDGTKELLSEKYFDLLNRYNEFGYFNKETFSIKLDSKENFDKNYESSWFYLFKVIKQHIPHRKTAAFCKLQMPFKGGARCI